MYYEDNIKMEGAEISVGETKTENFPYLAKTTICRSRALNKS